MNQTIAFAPIPNKTIGDASFPLTVSSSSSLAVTLATTSDKITLSGTQVTLVKAGRAIITASQAGNGHLRLQHQLIKVFASTLPNHR